MEVLKNYLEDQIGIDDLIKVFQELKTGDLKIELGKNSHLIPTITQLIFLEDLVY